MSILVDTSVWSLFLRRNPPELPELAALRDALAGTELVVTTGLVLQELLQGLKTAGARTAVSEQMTGMAYVDAERDDHLAAVDVLAGCRERGIQLGTIDALIAAMCIRRGMTLLTTDRDFVHAAEHSDLRVWTA